MNERWKRITDLFTAALEREGDDRQRYLDEACGPDAALRAELDSLLAAHGQSDEFLERPAAVAAGLVGHSRPDDLGPGRVLGPYRIDREVGRGGMGVVYEAEDTRLGRRVAVKVLTGAVGSDPTMRARLEREARAAAALSHPSIATVYSFEEIDGRACLVTEFVRGDTLRSEVARGPLGLDAVLDTGIQVARGLAAAHTAGIVHRDLKPDNIVRNRDGAVKILDFGIAHVATPPDPGAPRLTKVGDIIGTPGYMSPEQLEGSDVDPRSDIFALGVLLFELSTGRHPFTGTTPGSTVAKVLAANPPPPSSDNPALPPELDAIVRGCLQRHRAARYASAADLARDLQSVRDGRPWAGPMPSAGAARMSGRPLWWWRVHQVVRMAVISALVYGVWRVHVNLRSDWGLAMLLAYVVTGAINGTLRAHLLFISAVNLEELRDEFRRARPLVLGTDLLLSLVLLLAAFTVARGQTLLPSILSAVAVGWAVAALVIEPAVCKAAFPKS